MSTKIIVVIIIIAIIVSILIYLFVFNNPAKTESKLEDEIYISPEALAANQEIDEKYYWDMLSMLFTDPYYNTSVGDYSRQRRESVLNNMASNDVTNNINTLPEWAEYRGTKSGKLMVIAIENTSHLENYNTLPAVEALYNEFKDKSLI